MKLETIYKGRPHLLDRLPDRFWSKVDIGDPDECWEWQAYRFPSGRAGLMYGRFGLDGKSVTAHRVAYLLTRGAVADDLFVLHKCDNPPCCNPAHLFAGTARDNAADRDRKGRYIKGLSYRGPENARAKLTDTEIAEIRRTYVPHAITREMLAQRFSVSVSSIDHVLSGNTYQDSAPDAPLRPKKPMPALRTRCPRGHLYDSINSEGARICTLCQKAARRRHREKKRHGTIAAMIYEARHVYNEADDDLLDATVTGLEAMPGTSILTREKPRYGMGADLRYDGDERYFVYEYRGHGDHRTRRLITVTGSYSSAAKDIDELTAGGAKELLRPDPHRPEIPYPDRRDRRAA